MAVKSKREVLGMTGDEVAAYAMKQINPDVVAAYPITPQTEIVMNFSQYVADGVVQTEFVPVESEHSAMSATVGASAAGARAMTATSSQGLALMWEILYIASALRLPIVMPVVNRALSGNINIHCDHSDAMGARDSGWIQIFSENVQEVYDNIIQAVRIAEGAFLPVMVNQDGFIISHAMEPVEVLSDEEVQQFIGERKHPYRLLEGVDGKPFTVGPLDFFDYYFEHKRSQIEAMKNAKSVIEEIAQEYARLTGRKYGLYEYYGSDNPELIIVTMGSSAGTSRTVVEALNRQGEKIALLKLRVFRPFPYEEVEAVLKNARIVAVFDRAVSYGAHAPLYGEILGSMYYSDSKPFVVSFIYGLGGRDFLPSHVEEAIAKAREAYDSGKIPEQMYLGLRE